MIGNASTKLGVVLVVAGALLMAGPIFGFSTLAADRGVDVGAAEDPNAILGIEKLDVTVEDHQSREDILVIHNNFDSEISLEAEVVIQGEGLTDPSGFDTSVLAGETTSFAVSCEQGTGSGTTPIELTVIDASTPDGVSVSALQRTYEIDRDCPGRSDPGGGFQSVTASDVSGSGTATQTFTFVPETDIAKNAGVSIDIESQQYSWLTGANYSTASATVIDGHKHDTASISSTGPDATIEYSNQKKIKAGEGVQIEVSAIEFDTGVVGSGFGTAEFFHGGTGESLSDSFAVSDESFSWWSTASTRTADDPDIVRAAELDSVPIDELDGVETRAELAQRIEDDPEYTLVGTRD